jgi:hypothetical protein
MHTVPVVVQAAVRIAAADLLVAIVVAAFVDNQQVRCKRMTRAVVAKRLSCL